MSQATAMVMAGCIASWHASSDRIIYFNKNGGGWRFNSSVHLAKGDRSVRARALPACDNIMSKIVFDQNCIDACKMFRPEVFNTSFDQGDPDQKQLTP